jgi:anti-repressor protein
LRPFADFERHFLFKKIKIMADLAKVTGLDNQTMSSLEIAELTGKAHSDVVYDIKRILLEVGIEGGDFSAPCKMPSGQNTTVYNLPKRECNLIVSGYSAKYRLAIIDRWEELENSHPKLPKTFSEALKLASEQAEIIEQQHLLISEQTPKVEVFERVLNGMNTYTLDTISDTLNIGRTTLSKKLKDLKWAMQDSSKGTSSTRYAETNGYAKTVFEIVVVSGKEIKVKKIVLTKKGLDKLIQLI